MRMLALRLLVPALIALGLAAPALAQVTRGGLYSSFLPVPGGRLVPLPPGYWTAKLQDEHTIDGMPWWVVTLVNDDPQSVFKITTVRVSTLTARWGAGACQAFGTLRFQERYDTDQALFDNCAAGFGRIGPRGVERLRTDPYFVLKDLGTVYTAQPAESLRLAFVRAHRFNQNGVRIDLYLGDAVGTKLEENLSDAPAVRAWAARYVQALSRSYFDRIEREIHGFDGEPASTVADTGLKEPPPEPVVPLATSTPPAAPAVAPTIAAAPTPMPPPPALAPATHRRALVIGNDAYKHVPRLDNAIADAAAMADRLRSLGYQVSLLTDVTEKRLKSALRQFKGQVQAGDEVAIFYAGHGVQFGGTNYLLPVDVQGESEEQVRDDAVPLERLLEDMSERKARFTLALVDACRDNPFKVAGTTRSIGMTRGLAPTQVATGQMIVFSAGAGQRALDRLGPEDKERNGVFTRVFLREMMKPGVTVDQVARTVRNQVVAMARRVGHEQVPAIYDQVIGEFYFSK